MELQIADKKSVTSESPLSQYLAYVDSLDRLVEEYPKYASARNNRAQALRRIYGSGILVNGTEEMKSDAPVLDASASDECLISASTTILDDLSTAISLLTPKTPFMPLSRE